MRKYGKELILDLHKCDPNKFNRNDIENYFIKLCELIDMERCDLHWWDDVDVPLKEQQTEPHLKGTSAVQFIITSNIVIHTLDMLKAVYVNVFSCKEYDDVAVAEFTAKWFNGNIVHKQTVERI